MEGVGGEREQGHRPRKVAKPNLLLLLLRTTNLRKATTRGEGGKIVKTPSTYKKRHQEGQKQRPL